jgi:hypothetical protein
MAFETEYRGYTVKQMKNGRYRIYAGTVVIKRKEFPLVSDAKNYIDDIFKHTPFLDT